MGRTTAARLASEEFVGLILRNQHEMLRFIRVLAGRRDDSDEILQETVARLLEKQHEFDPSRPFLPWALKFAHLQTLKHRTRRSKDKRMFSAATIDALVAAQPELVADDARLDALRECLGRLPSRDLELLHAKYWFHNPAAEIARNFGRTPKAIYRRLDRVREMLLDCIERGIAQAAHRVS